MEILTFQEALLHKLQASVEAEEAKWKQSLSDQQAELDALKEQNAKMETCVQSAEEVNQWTTRPPQYWNNPIFRLTL